MQAVGRTYSCGILVTVLATACEDLEYLQTLQLVTFGAVGICIPTLILLSTTHLITSDFTASKQIGM